MWQILHGNNVDHLRQFADNTFDSIVTDPPYGIDFLGKAWDANVGALETYQQCLRVLKPGGHILAFSAARTYHHLAVTLEQAGFEIRDQIMWIYSSGFPKSQDIGRQLHKKTRGKPDKQRFDPAIMIHVKDDQYQHPDSGVVYRKLPDINGDRLAVSHEGIAYGTVYEQIIEVDNEWSGWGTALKPAHEPIALARKPLSERNIKDNCVRWGVGALNIDATRIPRDDQEIALVKSINAKGGIKIGDGIEKYGTIGQDGSSSAGRVELNEARFPSNVIGEVAGPYQKYFYCPKVSRAERHLGFDTAKIPQIGSTHPDDVKRHPLWDPSIGGDAARLKKKITEAGQYKGNTHPTVKPIDLMRYLIRLVTPAGGHVLDPFNGSGSTGCAAVDLGMNYTGIELDPGYVAIAQRRIEAWEQKHKSGTTFEELFE